MRVLGIDHVGIAVAELEEAMTFLHMTLGLVTETPVELHERGVAVQFADTGAGKIELLAPIGDASPVATFLAKRGPGLHHICLIVDDIHEFTAALAQKGVAMADPEPWMSPHGWAAFVHPKHWAGVSIELREFVATD